MLNNMTIKARLILLVSAIMAVIVFNQGVSYYANSKTQSAMQDIAERRIHLIRTANRIMFALADERAEVMAALQHDPSSTTFKSLDHPTSKHLDKIASNKTRLDEYFADLGKH